MTRLASILTILVSVYVTALPAEAFFPHGTPASGGPVLASVTNTFGNLTKSGYGGERLSRTDQNYGARYSPKGTGVLVSGSCAKWSTSVTSGNSAYWNLLSHVAEGTSAVTPTPTATGVSNQLGGAGSHTDFLVSCEDSSNNVLATSTLTYSIYGGENSCGAVNIGSTDNVGSAYYPAGFASSVDGCYVLMSTGFYKTGRFSMPLPFAHTTYLTFADPDRPGELQNLETNSNTTHAVIKDVMVVGATTNCSGCVAAFVLGGTDTSADNIHAYATPAMRAAGSHSCLSTNVVNTTTGPGSAYVTHFGCEYYDSFFDVTSNYTFQYGWFRWGRSDATKTAGYVHDFKVLDIAIIAMKLPLGNHPDCFQIGDGSTAWNFEAKRIMCLQGGGDIAAQGIFFGGGPTGVGNSFSGYISDSNCTGAAGQSLCVVTGGAQSNGNGSKIFSPGGSPMAVSDAVSVNCGGTPCPGAASFTAVGSGTNLTISSVTGTILVGHFLHGTGISQGTTILSQSSGTTGKAGVYVTSSATTVNGAATSGPAYPLTGLSGDITFGSEASPVNFYGSYNVGGVWDMIWNAGYVPQGVYPAGNGGTSSITHFSDMYQTTVGQSVVGVPHLKFQNCQTTDLWQSGLAVSKGAEYTKWDSDCAVTTNAPVGTTVSDVLSANSNTTTLASWYVNGDPKSCLEAKSTADWDALSVQAAMVYAASCTIVKTGGPLDLGSGEVANSIGTALTPEWADGTVVGTGFTGQ